VTNTVTEKKCYSLATVKVISVITYMENRTKVSKNKYQGEKFQLLVTPAVLAAFGHWSLSG
jgi:hypothetical protein